MPIFWRRYCWTTPQSDTLWQDVLKQKQHSIRHSLGRLTCTNVNVNVNVESNDSTRSIIIDGQQHFTSVALLLSAIRDSLLSLGISSSKEGDALLQSIHQMLFLEPLTMEQWVAGSNNNTVISEGMALKFCRLVPTFCDRSAYLAAILPPSIQQVQIFLAKKYNPR